ncbi:MAG: YicC family protein [Flavobacteriaceae bacterium]|nr:YicC family protein [Flavobacteriaceae bacterium]
MIQSMTGYGKSILQLPTKKITIELKSLNSKNLDLNTRIPSKYRQKEIQIRRNLAKKLVRGKIDVSFFVETTAEELTAKINKDIVIKYLEQLREISEEEGLLSIVMRLPDVLKIEREELDEDEWSLIENTISEAVNYLQKFRSDEGEALKKDFVLRIEAIRSNLNEVIDLDEERLLAVRERLQKAISDLEVTVDENKFEQEMIYYLEKLDITEEKVRLNNHLSYFIEELNGDISNGKKLAFISQEIGREINTIGSKANFSPMQKQVVQMKDELEKIKEQLLNVL